MPSIEKLKENRKKKLKAIQRRNREVYPSEAGRTHTLKEVLDKFEEISDSEKEIVLNGRVRSTREHGKVTFCDIQDGTGKLQIMLRENRLGEKGYQFFLNHYDMGDFIEVKGNLIKTKTGEKTLVVNDYKMLAKALRPLPEKWHGLQDKETRYRKRSLDLIFNEETKQKFITRSKIIKEIRKFLESKGFLEVETPILQTVPGGANATPFKTHLNALDLDLYLRIAPELYLKRLLVGGFEKVYEIGRVFRNEGMDRSHNPDFTTLEFYKAYSTYKDLMDLTEEMFGSVLEEVFGSTKIEYNGKEIDFSPTWERKEFSHLIEEHIGIKWQKTHPEALREKAKELGVEVEDEEPKAEVLDKIYKKKCRDEIWEPTFIIHHPKGAFPLAKSLKDHPEKLANFQLVAGGWELINAFSELNDPIEQRERFEQQEKFREKGLEEAQRMDEEFLKVLEHGMPPAAGFGMGIDRLTALLTNSDSLREVILFPLMKPKGE